MCKEFKQAREEADEVAELDCGNIISTGQKAVTLNGKIEQRVLLIQVQVSWQIERKIVGHEISFLAYLKRTIYLSQILFRKKLFQPLTMFPNIK